MTALAGVDVTWDGRGGGLVDVTRLEAVVDRLEQALSDSAEAERVAFDRWQDAYGAYEVARDEAAAAWSAWTRAVA